ncbi:DinB family protein [Brachybacterium subflavum]|uniref:DinB family protein n=1 Tax=Brachybacterium subflavum TaxID=2585206 RepID=UPI0012668433|nr:DinB family protein [Brachybacterium subflavum]
MYAPAQDTEVDGLVGYIDSQLDALRASLHGLTEEQAHATPCRSALSVGALVKHAIYVMRGASGRLTAGPRLDPLTQEGYEKFADSTVLGEDESAAALLPVFDAVRENYLAALRATDPEAPSQEAPAPWFGITEPTPILQRYYLVHQVEELARHAGHAEIIREQIDGVTIPTILMSLAGQDANAFFSPYAAPAGTITG